MTAITITANPCAWPCGCRQWDQCQNGTWTRHTYHCLEHSVAIGAKPHPRTQHDETR